MPVPVSATGCEVVPALVAVKVAVFAPAEVGLKMMLTVQLAPTATPVPHVFVSENWLALVPDIVKAEMGRSTVPVFVIVTTCAGLAAFTGSLPNAAAAGETV
jgi:hypothetical protein